MFSERCTAASLANILLNSHRSDTLGCDWTPIVYPPDGEPFWINVPFFSKEVLNESGKRFFTIKVLVLIEFPARTLLFKNIFCEYALLSPMINFVVLIAVLYDLLWFINVNEQNIKKWAFVISLLKEDETDQAIEEPDEIMHINRDSESKYEKSDRHETFELN
ncbi:uncharacterized protein TNCV_1156201 [Trichonephila clavipes]|nr:uncharacterized protein TNCV_1156201 [Trichonephila clavipes]